MIRFLPLIALLPAPALAAGGPFFSLRNTDFVVFLSFLLFVGIVIYLKVPAKVLGMLDDRAANIQAELDEAKALREEAQTILASYERKQKEVAEQATRIVETAKTEAEEAAKQAKADLEVSIARRLKAAEDQIANAEAAAIKEVRDTAITNAIAAAADVIAAKASASDQNALIDDAIGQLRAKLH